MELKAKATKDHKDKHYQPQFKQYFPSWEGHPEPPEQPLPLTHTWGPSTQNAPSARFAKASPSPQLRTVPALGEWMKHPARIISLHLSATLYSAGSFFMYFSILYEELATCLDSDLKVFRWPEALFLSFWLHWTLIFWR